MNVTLWPIWDAGDGTLYADKHDRTHPTNVGYEMYCRRFKESELAAEYWLASSRRERMLNYHDGKGSATQRQADLELDRMETVERFATLPDAEETDYE